MGVTPTSPRAVLHHTDANSCTILHTTVFAEHFYRRLIDQCKLVENCLKTSEPQASGYIFLFDISFYLGAAWEIFSLILLTWKSPFLWDSYLIDHKTLCLKYIGSSHDKLAKTIFRPKCLHCKIVYDWTTSLPCRCRIYKTGPNPTQNSESGYKSSALPQTMAQCQKACKKKGNSVQIMLKDLYCKIVTESLFNRVSK